MTFQLTAPREGRHLCRSGTDTDRHFNSRPREGADHKRRTYHHETSISTHGPARGPTPGSLDRKGQNPISTHGPARGPTLEKMTQEGKSSISTHGPARGPTAILDNDPLSKIVFFILLHNFKDFSITFLYGFFFFHTKSAFFQVRIFWEFSGHLAFARKLHVKQTFSIHSPH